MSLGTRYRRDALPADALHPLARPRVEAATRALEAAFGSNLTAVVAYGSSVATRGGFRDGSDVDLLVVVREASFETCRTIGATLARISAGGPQVEPAIYSTRTLRWLARYQPAYTHSIVLSRVVAAGADPLGGADLEGVLAERMAFDLATSFFQLQNWLRDDAAQGAAAASESQSARSPRFGFRVKFARGLLDSLLTLRGSPCATDARAVFSAAGSRYGVDVAPIVDGVGSSAVAYAALERLTAAGLRDAVAADDDASRTRAAPAQQASQPPAQTAGPEPASPPESVADVLDSVREVLAPAALRTFVFGAGAPLRHRVASVGLGLGAVLRDASVAALGELAPAFTLLSAPRLGLTVRLLSPGEESLFARFEPMHFPPRGRPWLAPSGAPDPAAEMIVVPDWTTRLQWSAQAVLVRALARTGATVVLGAIAGSEGMLASAFKMVTRAFRAEFQATLLRRGEPCAADEAELFARCGARYGVDTAPVLRPDDAPEQAYRALLELESAALADLSSGDAVLAP